MFAELIISAIQTAAVSLLLFYWQRKQGKNDKDKKEITEDKREESLLTMELIMASAALSYANAWAIERGCTNGEMQEAKRAYRRAEEKYKEYERKQAANRMNA